MNRELARKIADTVLYEGYMLYPYRPSAIKNRQRWSFGTLYPPKYGEVRLGTERSQMHSEFLLKITGDAVIDVQVRFLHLLARELLRAVDGHLERVESMVVDGSLLEGWDEGVERSVDFKVIPGDELEQFFHFGFDGVNESEPLRDVGGNDIAEISHSQDAIEGTMLVASRLLRDDVMKVSIDMANATALPTYADDRDSALMSCMLSAHMILSASGGEFISLMDPPDELRNEVQACRNIGNFPVLLGNEGDHDMLLCSPIVLYDYPQIAPESSGDFYDGTEIDEMLTLRVMTLTEKEKNVIRMGDDRVRSLLQRTEEGAREQLMKTHGAIRSMRRASGQ